MKSDKHIIWLVPGFADGENDTTCLTYLQSMLRTFEEEYPQIRITVFTFQYPFKKGWYKLTLYKRKKKKEGKRFSHFKSPILFSLSANLNKKTFLFLFLISYTSFLSYKAF